jgi:type II secretion system protein G
MNEVELQEEPGRQAVGLWVWAGSLVVLVELVALAGFLVYPMFVSHGDLSRVDVDRAAVGRTGRIAKGLKLYRRAAGEFPAGESGLRLLVEPPKDPNSAAKWIGPYVEDPNILVDTWGNPLRYQYPGVHNKGSYDLWSAGPDGIDGTEDDITNWGAE